MKRLTTSSNYISLVTLAVFALFLLNACKTQQKSAIPINAEKRESPPRSGDVLSSKNKLKFEHHFYDGNKEKILGNFDDAIKLYYVALDANPNSGAALFELGSIYLQKQDLQRALYYSKKAVGVEPDNVWYQLLYITCLKETKKWPDVVIMVQKLIKQYPNNIEYYYELANAYLYLNKASNAIDVYNDVEKRFGYDKEIELQKIKIFQATKDYDKAIETTKLLIAKYPNDFNNYGILGDIYQSKGDSEKALNAYQEMIKAAPDNPYAHLVLADFYRNQKKYDKSFEEILIAFKSKDLDIDTKVKMLLSYYYVSETKSELKADAFKLCEILVEVHPDEAKAFSIYGDFLYREKKSEEARNQYRKAIALDKDKFSLWTQLLIIDSELNDNVSLIKDSKEAMELFPSQPLPYLFNGSANMQLKKYNEALNSFNQGKQYVIDNATLLSQFYGYIGDVQNQLKNYPESDAAYDKALELDKSNATVMNNYAYYLSLRNYNLEKAEVMSKKSNELDPNNNSYQDTYGWVLYKLGKYTEAKKWIEKAIGNGGENNGTLLEHLGDIYFKLGETENAVTYWEKAKKTGDTTDLIDKKIVDKKLYE